MCLSDNHARAIIHLLADVAAHPGGHHGKKRALMKGLCTLIQADAWVWTLGNHAEAEDHQAYAGIMHGGFGKEQWVRFLQVVEHPDSISAAAQFYQQVLTTREHTTLTQTEMDPEGRALQGELGQRWKAVELGSAMLSGVFVDDVSLSVTGIYRRSGASSFTPDEKRITHFILSEVSWLHLLTWPEDRDAKVPKLYPRQRLVLNLLLEGYSRKHIGTELGIAEGTVSNYAKEIYRTFEVNSHPELMRKFLGGPSNGHHDA